MNFKWIGSEQKWIGSRKLDFLTILILIKDVRDEGSVGRRKEDRLIFIRAKERL